jgi:hypothetical protein
MRVQACGLILSSDLPALTNLIPLCQYRAMKTDSSSIGASIISGALAGASETVVTVSIHSVLTTHNSYHGM